MEHNPYITLNDDTEITYSDIKRTLSGQEYATIYFETPSKELGFCSMDVNYPEGIPHNIIGYLPEQVNKLMDHYNRIGALVFQFAKGEE